tara:strand:+ start:375 stop:1100 length:726 start_codon:yes stop_codon:yes gene_type:complete
MSTLRKLVSDIRSTHRIISTDARITDRAIASEIKINAITLIKRETNLRKLWASDTLFTTIPCLEMVEVPISECCDYVDPCTVARSKHKLPKVSEGNYQYVIQGVYSINAMGGNGTKIKEITINRYLNLLKLPIIKKESYFWISNGYLYVNNPLLTSVRFVAFLEDDVPKDIMYPDCECSTSYTLDDYCMNPLDKQSFIPGYLEQQTLAMTSTKLLGTYFNIKDDTSNEGIDGQTATSQPTN